jgi:MoaA/NifB/PqqE/SkfB family radical SAM enzyme
MEPSELVIIWRVTGHCDLDCPFCAYACSYARSIERPRLAADPDQVTAFGALLRDYARQYNRDILVSWLGGEPLTWPPLMALTRAFKHEYRLRVSVTTNGIALKSSAMREHIAADYDQITISMDGVAQFHDHMRGTAGLYDQLCASIMSLAQLKARRGYGPLLRVNTILMRHNIHQLEPLCQALAECGVEELTFNTLGGRDRPEFFPDNRLLPEQVDWLRQELPQLRKRMAGLGLGLRICGSPAYLDRVANFAAGNPVPVADCAPGQHSLFIDERGWVSPCNWTLSDGVPLAQITSPASLQDLPGRLSARRQQNRLPACSDCMSTEVFGKFAHPYPYP